MWQKHWRPFETIAEIAERLRSGRCGGGPSACRVGMSRTLLVLS